MGSSWMLVVGSSFVKRDGTKPFLIRKMCILVLKSLLAVNLTMLHLCYTRIGHFREHAAFMFTRTTFLLFNRILNHAVFVCLFRSVSGHFLVENHAVFASV